MEGGRGRGRGEEGADLGVLVLHSQHIALKRVLLNEETKGRRDADGEGGALDGARDEEGAPVGQDEEHAAAHGRERRLHGNEGECVI